MSRELVEKSESKVTDHKLRLVVLIAAGLIVVAVSVVLFLSEIFSGTHSAVSPENGPLAIRLSSLAGFGWLLIGLGIGSSVAAETRSRRIIALATTGGLLGGGMGFLAWLFISFNFSS